MGPELRACESASDVVQSVCLELLEREQPFEWRGRDSFRQWLFITALNKVRQHLRHHRVRRRDATPCSEVDELQLTNCYARVLSPSQVLLSREAIARMESAFDALPEDYAEVITLRRLVGLPYAMIAAERGTSETAVRVLLHRALARLATLLDSN